MVRRRWFCRWVCPTGLCADGASRVGLKLGLRGTRLPAVGTWIAIVTLGGACLGYPIFAWLESAGTPEWSNGGLRPERRSGRRLVRGGFRGSVGDQPACAGRVVRTGLRAGGDAGLSGPIGCRVRPAQIDEITRHGAIRSAHGLGRCLGRRGRCRDAARAWGNGFGLAAPGGDRGGRLSRCMRAMRQLRAQSARREFSPRIWENADSRDFWRRSCDSAMIIAWKNALAAPRSVPAGRSCRWRPRTRGSGGSGWRA